MARKQTSTRGKIWTHYIKKLSVLAVDACAYLDYGTTGKSFNTASLNISIVVTILRWSTVIICSFAPPWQLPTSAYPSYSFAYSWHLQTCDHAPILSVNASLPAHPWLPPPTQSPTMLHRVQTPCCNNFFFSIKSKCGSDLAHTNDMAVPDFPARPILISCRPICTYQHSRLSRSEWNALRRRSRASWSSFRVALPRQCRTFVIFSIRVQRSSGWPQRRGHGPLYHPRFVLGGTVP